ncbi:MAG TPA: SprT family zinc-dependent metalloprotease [Kaistiaceae bacterium]|nr:SprT family zinc-dependent metalloprotease [Kaistiaceae bacterium]
MFLPLRLKPAPEPDRIALLVAGAEVDVVIRRHAGARRLKLAVDAARGRFVLTIPPRMALKTALAFLETHRDWIAARRGHLVEARPFVDGAEVPLRGIAHRVAHRPERRGTVWLEADAGQPVLGVAGEAPHLNRRLTDFLKREARRDLKVAVAVHAAALAVEPRQIRLKDTRSRWGSCSAEGVLNFSWRLILAPPQVLDYVAAHEVAHLVEMNHSRRFWRLVDGLVPQWENSRAWLRHHGEGLHGYGADRD